MNQILSISCLALLALGIHRIAMPTNFVADQAVKRSSKQYGETTVSDNARVHLGDVLQGVNVNGDLHLHYHRELNDFTGPSAVIEFLDLCQELISHHDLVQHDLAQLREYSYFQARTLNTLLERLARLRSQLSHEHACIPRGADKGHGQEVRSTHDRPLTALTRNSLTRASRSCAKHLWLSSQTPLTSLDPLTPFVP